MRVMLVTESLRSTPRFVSALVHAGVLIDGTDLVVGSFSPAERSSAALLSRLGVPVISLASMHAPTPELALAALAYSTKSDRLVMWDCPRGAAALHPLLRRVPSITVDYVLPWMDASPWGEAALIAQRAANLISTFVIEDPGCREMLEVIGVPGEAIRELDIDAIGVRTPDGSNARALVVEGDPKSIAGFSGGTPALRRTMVRCTAAAATAIALGLAPRTGTLVLPNPSPESLMPGLLAAMRGWRVLAPAHVARRAPSHLSPIPGEAWLTRKREPSNG